MDTEEIHTDKKWYYVSAVDGSKKYLVAGPYARHEDALRARPIVSRYAREVDHRAHFMEWGTAGSDAEHKTPLGPEWNGVKP